MNNISSFIIYFNKFSGKLEEVHTLFTQDFIDSDGKHSLKTCALGHENCYKILKKRKIPLSDIILLGSFVENNKNFSVLHIRPVPYLSFNSQDIREKAVERNISMMEERKHFSDVVLNFVLGSISEERFSKIMQGRIFGLKSFLTKRGLIINKLYKEVVSDYQH